MNKKYQYADLTNLLHI